MEFIYFMHEPWLLLFVLVSAVIGFLVACKVSEVRAFKKHEVSIIIFGVALVFISVIVGICVCVSDIANRHEQFDRFWRDIETSYGIDKEFVDDDARSSIQIAIEHGRALGEMEIFATVPEQGANATAKPGRYFYTISVVSEEDDERTIRIDIYSEPEDVEYVLVNPLPTLD